MLQYKIIDYLCRSNKIKIEIIKSDESEIFFDDTTLYMTEDWKIHSHIDDYFFEIVYNIAEIKFFDSLDADEVLNWTLEICKKYGAKVSSDRMNSVLEEHYVSEVPNDNNSVSDDNTIEDLIDRYGIPLDVVLSNYYGDFYFHVESYNEKTNKVSGVMFKDGEKYHRYTYRADLEAELYRSQNSRKEKQIDQKIESTSKCDDSIVLTKQQISCINYTGNKNKDLVVVSAAGGGKSFVIIERALKFLHEAKENNRENTVAVFTHNYVLAKYLKELMRLKPSDEKYIKVGTVQEFINDAYWDMPGFKLGNKAYDKVKENAINEALNKYSETYKNYKYVNWGTRFWQEEFAWMRNMNIYDGSDRKDYLALKREGRGHEHHMSNLDRNAAFDIFVIYQSILRKKKVYDDNPSGNERALYLSHNPDKIPKQYFYDHILIDEAQDQTLTNIIVLKTLAREDITICMDVNQRIYEYRWHLNQAGLKSTSKTLSYPFRCTSQIDELAESLKRNNEIDDEESVEHIVPIANGEKPEIVECANENEEIEYVTMLVKKWLQGDKESNNTIGIMCYTKSGVKKICGWLSKAHIPFQEIDKEADFSILTPGVKVCTMHTSKGLEFKRVILPQFYQGMIPQKWALKDEEVLIKQRNTAYVAMTRAKHQLVIVYNGNESQFINEMDANLYTFSDYEDAVLVDKEKPMTSYEPRRLPKELDVEKPEIEAKDIIKEQKAKMKKKDKWSIL